ncbi:oxygen-independent coproporphyrinogen-3 oxidase [Peptoniphilus olsenii]|uniref:Heme chaperone HemW n=2 Tax=Peptoniphilus olsenii TaxID=411570 RepID=A0ABV2JBX6_9FIRM
MMKKINTGIYIHIPFCESRCHYCDFCSSIIDKNQVGKYFKYLKKEIMLYDELLKNRIIDTIFIGGGTPSSVDEKYIGDLFDLLNRYEIKSDAEITIETNPNSLTLTKANAYKSFGINRISIGAQSFNDKILKTIGRIHTKKQIYKAVENANKANINNINIDLMSSLPQQKFKDIENSLDEIKKLNPTHISYYSLILEENTKLFEMYQHDDSPFIGEITDRKMYHYIVEKLRDMNYEQYEISNFAKDGYKCRHNIRYWKLKDYISFGMSSSSNIENLRYTNSSNFNDYYSFIDKNKKPITFSETLSIQDRINEFIIMGIRLNDGVNIEEINKRFNIDFENLYKYELDKNILNGLVEKNKYNIKLTSKGRDLSNQVELDFLK